jgi:ribose/xylose/arabinose/galactoside ABC-type transport system permease subunit
MKIKKSLTSYLPKTGATYGIILFLLVFSFSVDNYMSISNFTNIARQAAVLCILTICAFLAILTHQLDLSIGGVCGLTGMVVALLLEKQASLLVACLAGLATGMAFGLLNGFLAGMTTIPTFIVTLATMNIAESLGMVIRTGTIQITNSTFVWLSNGNIGHVPFSLLLVAVMYLIFWYILKYRPYGTRLYAVGGREEVALAAGINVKYTKVSVYLINGLLAGVAGILMASRLSSANPSAAMGYELDAICATVLGGTALSGGRGKIGGAFLGAIAISMLRNGMNIMGLQLVTQKMVIGAVLIIILAVDVLRKESKQAR